MKLFSKRIGQGPDLVLLHGWAIHSEIWQPLIAKLSHEFRLTLIDLPGFGQSKPVDDYSVENIVNLLLTCAPEKATWIGWSLGGLIATKLAYLHPDRVTKLIAIASSPRFLKEEGWAGISETVLRKFSQHLSLDYEATLMRFVLLQFHGMPLNRAVIRQLQQNLFLYGKPTVDTLNNGLTLLQSLDLRTDILRIQCPILYLLGKLDTLVPWQVASILEGLNPQIQTKVFPKASHALFLSHEHDFITELRRFCYG